MLGYTHQEDVRKVKHFRNASLLINSLFLFDEVPQDAPKPPRCE